MSRPIIILRSGILILMGLLAGRLVMGDIANKLPQEDSLRILRHLHQRGEISAPALRYLTERISKLAEPVSKITDRKNGPVSATIALKKVREWISENLPAQFKVVQMPPPSIGYVESEDTLIRVYYNSSDLHPLAQDALAMGNETWKKQIGELGFRPPYTGEDSDTSESPLVTPGIWFYLGDTWELMADGYAEPLANVDSSITPWTDCSSRIVLATYLDGEMLKVIIDHEFSHAVQMATDCAETPTAAEPFAVYMETLLNPDSKLFAYFALYEFQDYPEYSLDYFDANGGYQYGAALFPIFLEEYYGSADGGLTREIWERCMQNGEVKLSYYRVTIVEGENDPNWFEAIDAALRDRGSSFDEAFQIFSQWRYFTGGNDDGRHFKDGPDYQTSPVKLAGKHQQELIPLLNGGPLKIYPYGVAFIELSLNSPPSDNKLLFKVTVENKTSWNGSVLIFDGSGLTRTDSIRITEGVGIYTLSGFEGLEKLVFIILNMSNGDYDPDKFSWSSWYNAARVNYSLEWIEAFQLETLSPSTAYIGTSVNFLVDGSGFINGPLFEATLGEGITVHDHLLINTRQLLLMAYIEETSPGGTYDLVMKNGDGETMTLPNVFTVKLFLKPDAGEIPDTETPLSDDVNNDSVETGKGCQLVFDSPSQTGSFLRVLLLFGIWLLLLRKIGLGRANLLWVARPGIW